MNTQTNFQSGKTYVPDEVLTRIEVDTKVWFINKKILRNGEIDDH